MDNIQSQTAINDKAAIKKAMHDLFNKERETFGRIDPDSPPPPYQPTPQEIARACHDNEDGDARLFCLLNRGKWIRDHSLEAWFMFSKHFWKQDLICQVMADIASVIDCYQKEADRLMKESEDEGKNFLKDRAEDLRKRVTKLQTLPRKMKVLAIAAHGDGSLGIDGSQWDRTPMLMGCENGILDLRIGGLRQGYHDEFIKTWCPTPWEGLDSPRPNWEHFLLDVFDNDTELIGYLQRLLGYAITGISTEDILPILQGKGRNGKSTLLETLHYVLGDLSGPIDSEMLLDNYGGRNSAAASPEIIDLRGKRLVWASETDDGRRLNSSRVKWLTGEEILKGRPLYAKPVEFHKTHTLFLLTNALPHASGNDYALWKRIHLIPFKFSYVDDPAMLDEKKADKNLAEKLKQEATGILAWMVEGCLIWQSKGLAPPAIVTAETLKYQKNEDTIGRFLDEACRVDTNGGVKAGDLFRAYKEWCSGEGLRYVNGTRFGIEMKKRLDYEPGRHITYIGIRLMTPTEREEELQ